MQELDELEVYMKLAGRFKRITPEEEISLAKQIGSGSIEARNKMVAANLRLVFSVAKRYRNVGMEYIDLISEGNLGLIKAAERFDPDRGTRFSTYAVWWIRQAITEAISYRSGTIHIPTRARELTIKWLRARESISNQLGREPRHEEVFESLGYSRPRRRDVERALSARQIEDVNGSHMSSRTWRVDFENRDELRKMLGLIENLNEEEARVLQMHFVSEKSCYQISKEFGMSRSWATGVKKRALEKLRSMMQGD